MTTEQIVLTTGQKWKNLTGLWMSWLFDAMDAGLYSFVIVFLIKDFNSTLPEVVSVVSYFLIATAVGGVFMGNIGDRIGRKRAIVLSIAAYGVFNTLCGTANSITEIIIYRTIVGFAVGGLWGSAAALISEIWDPKSRGKALAIMQTGWSGGNLLAAVFAMNLIPAFGWRGMFFATGVPAAIAFFFVLFFVQESPLWLASRGLRDQNQAPSASIMEIFKGENLRTTILALLVSICGMFGWWIIFTFLPTYLANVLHINMAKSATFVMWTGIGAVLGYLVFGYLCDKIGRRITFSIFFTGMAIMVPTFLYVVTTFGDTFLVLVATVLGFFTGYFSGFGPWYSELFGTSIRSTASGFCFNGGRAAIFIAPPVVAKYLIPNFGFAAGIGSAAVAYLIAAILVFTLKETKGKELSAKD